MWETVVFIKRDLTFWVWSKSVTCVYDYVPQKTQGEDV